MPVPVSTKPPSAADELLPPGAAEISPETKPSVGEDLLPPGASDSDRAAAGKQVALASDVKNQPIAKDDKEITITTEDGTEVTLHEPVKKVGVGENAIELRSLTPEEKSRRRLIKNIIVFSFCVLVLGISVIVLIAIQSD